VTIYVVVPFLVVVAVLQTTLLTHLTVWSVFVDLPLLVVVSWGLLQGPKEGIVWGFIAGVAVDLLSGAPFGAATLSLMAAGALAGLGRRSIYAAHVVFPAGIMFLATIAYDVLFLSIVWVSGQPVSWLDSLLRIILPSAVLNALLMPLVFAAMRVFSARFVQEEMEW
jgi:rod shape-determining protein MreD